MVQVHGASSSMMHEAHSKPERIFGLPIAWETLQSTAWPLGVSRASVSTCIHVKSWRSQQLRGWVIGSDPHVSVRGQSAWGVLLEQILQFHLIQKGTRLLAPESPWDVNQAGSVGWLGRWLGKHAPEPVKMLTQTYTERSTLHQFLTDLVYQLLSKTQLSYRPKALINRSSKEILLRSLLGPCRFFSYMFWNSELNQSPEEKWKRKEGKRCLFFTTCSHLSFEGRLFRDKRLTFDSEIYCHRLQPAVTNRSLETFINENCKTHHPNLILSAMPQHSDNSQMKTLNPTNVMRWATQKCGMMCRKLQGFVLSIQKLIHRHHCDNKTFFPLFLLY